MATNKKINHISNNHEKLLGTMLNYLKKPSIRPFWIYT